MTTDPTHTYACILGTHPELSFFELERVAQLLEDPISDLRLEGTIAFMNSATPLDTEQYMKRLGGTIKIVHMVGPFDEETVADWLIDQITGDTKFHFGFSLYSTTPHASLKKHWGTLNRLGITLKRTLKEQQISARFVSSKEVALSSVIVHKERLLKHGAEVVIIQTARGMEFGKTVAVQPFQAYSKRDYGRPQRDHRSGMLPPKLAQMMINCAAPKKGDVILDPFCGSGTVLQEALLLGYTKVEGSDITKKSINDTTANLKWLHLPEVPLSVCDVLEIRQHRAAESVDCIVAEGYLGPPQPLTPEKARDELTSLYQKAITALAQVLAPGGRMVIALPAWRKMDTPLLTISIQKTITAAGLQSFHTPLLYGRPDARVLRQIHFLQKQ